MFKENEVSSRKLKTQRSMLLYSTKSFQWKLKYAFGLTHVVLWGGAGLLIDKMVPYATNEKMQRMRVACTVLSLAGASFLGFTHYNAGYWIKTITYDAARQGFHLKTFRLFSRQRSIPISSTKLLDPLLETRKNSRIQTTVGTFNMDRNGLYTNIVFLSKLLN